MIQKMIQKMIQPAPAPKMIQKIIQKIIQKMFSRLPPAPGAVGYIILIHFTPENLKMSSYLASLTIANIGIIFFSYSK